MISKKVIQKPIVKILIPILLVLLFLYWRSLPADIFDDPVSLVMEDRNGELLGAMIAADGQWRFPHNEQVPEKFKVAILHFEDKRFYSHPGFDPLAIGRALVNNIKKGRVTSGGSTISMQVIRLSRKGKSRSISEKVVEIILATRMEMRYSKEEILAFYASNAPFGGNVVGLDAACWRYFGKSPEKISWSEAACLAVLPNSPSLVNPGRNRELLKNKRDRLLSKMQEAGVIDEVSYELALTEPLPDKPHPLPQFAPHLLARFYLENKNLDQDDLTKYKSTLHLPLQRQVNTILQRHHEQLRKNEVHNAAAIVVKVETGEVMAYIGNVQSNGYDNSGDVDVIPAHRSSGSILKPLLYAGMLHEGNLLPDALIPDIPTQFGTFTPKNFNFTYDGAVPAKRALARSLNVPAVRMLLSYGTVRFHHQMRKMGMSTLTQPADHYGLSLILGGAETTLQDLATIYSGMARTLNDFNRTGKYYNNNFHALQFSMNWEKEKKKAVKSAELLDAASIYLTFDAMIEVTRPEEEEAWQYFNSSQRIAWKTGTSFGNRDAWAVGVTPEYVVAVWAGNADGEGRTGLTGVTAAAPILFDIFSVLKNKKWFELPNRAMEIEVICSKSGYRASDLCGETKETWIPDAGVNSSVCPYHTIVHLDKEKQYIVNSSCQPIHQMEQVSWFVLPPVIENFYKNKDPHYKPLPPMRSDCNSNTIEAASMELIYPRSTAKIMIPVELSGNKGKTVFEISHRNTESIVYWHIDDTYIGYTKGIHQKSVSPEPGKHTLVLVDEQGERLEKVFEILGE